MLVRELVRVLQLDLILAIVTIILTHKHNTGPSRTNSYHRKHHQLGHLVVVTSICIRGLTLFSQRPHLLLRIASQVHTAPLIPNKAVQSRRPHFLIRPLSTNSNTNTSVNLLSLRHLLGSLCLALRDNLLQRATSNRPVRTKNGFRPSLITLLHILLLNQCNHRPSHPHLLPFNEFPVAVVIAPTTLLPNLIEVNVKEA